MNKNELIGRLYRARKDIEDAKKTVKASFFKVQYLSRTPTEEQVYTDLVNQDVDLDCAFDRLTEILDNLCTMEE